MAKSNKDIALKNRIDNLIPQLIGSDSEIIAQIAGVVGISLKTASEHYRAFKAQQHILDNGFKEVCTHKWGNAFSTAGGLIRECLLCHETKPVKI